MDRSGLFRRIAFTAAWASAGLIVFGGIVRITQSGMGCGDDWPLCNGELVPTFTLPVAIEYGHRVYAAVVIVLFGALLVNGWRHHRDRSDLIFPAVLAFVLILLQALLGAITVWLELPPATVILHFVNALIATAAVLVAGLRAGAGAGTALPMDRFSGRALFIAALGMLAIFMGAWVANVDAGLACVGFPLCNGEVMPSGGFRVHLHWTHRVLAYVFVIFVGIGTWSALRRRGDDRRLRVAYWGLCGATIVQVAVAATMILQVLPPTWRALHVGFGTLVWMALVNVAFWERRRVAGVP